MNILMTGIQLNRRGFLAIMSLQSTFLAWYSVFSTSVLPHVFESNESYLMALASFNFVITITLLFSDFFIHKLDELRTICRCSIVLSTVGLLLFVSNTVISLIVIFVEGVFFGIGQLAALMYFWNLTSTEERGRAAGFAGFFSLLFFQFTSLIAQTLDFSIAILLSFVLSIGILSVKLLRPEKKALLTTKKAEKGHSFEKRTILLYSAPWILYSVINATLARTVSFYSSQYVSPSLYMFLLVLQALTASFGALCGGIIADLFGRRLSLGFALTLYGISAALAGLFVESHEALCFVYAVNGLNWGILWLLYGYTVWGDLANEKSVARRYSTGLAISFSSAGVGLLLTHQIFQITLISSALVSCVLIFSSNIPLLLAQELLPSDFRQGIKMQLYTNVVKKIRQKR